MRMHPEETMTVDEEVRPSRVVVATLIAMTTGGQRPHQLVVVVDTMTAGVVDTMIAEAEHMTIGEVVVVEAVGMTIGEGVEVLMPVVVVVAIHLVELQTVAATAVEREGVEAQL